MAQILITQFDYDRLQRLLAKKTSLDDSDRTLQAELAKGKIVTPEDVPDDVITMNSEVQFTDESGKLLTYWLVFPEDADLATGKISILSPIGCALLGYKVGDSIALNTPSGSRSLTVSAITHQPEREGHFDL